MQSNTLRNEHPDDSEDVIEWKQRNKRRNHVCFLLGESDGRGTHKSIGNLSQLVNSGGTETYREALHIHL